MNLYICTEGPTRVDDKKQPLWRDGITTIRSAAVRPPADRHIPAPEGILPINYTYALHRTAHPRTALISPTRIIATRPRLCRYYFCYYARDGGCNIERVSFAVGPPREPPMSICKSQLLRVIGTVPGNFMISRAVSQIRRNAGLTLIVDAI